MIKFLSSSPEYVHLNERYYEMETKVQKKSITNVVKLI